MEYYFYVILIFAIVLKLTVYLCWYQVRRRSHAREVRILMPDGSTRCAVITAQGRVHQTSSSHNNTPEERQNLPQADSLSPYDNQGMVEYPVQPHFGSSVNAQGQFTGPPAYNSREWKLPKYEEVAGMPPPYSTEEPEMARAVQPGEYVQEMPASAQVLIPPPAYPSCNSIQVTALPGPAPQCAVPQATHAAAESPLISSGDCVSTTPTNATTIPSNNNQM